MAIFHLRVDKISRGKGRSAVASAAYHADEPLRDERTGLRHVMPLRQGLLHAEILQPAGVSATIVEDRESLWNAVEAREKRVDANTALLWFVALPHELGREASITLARSFAHHLVERFGCVIDLTVREAAPGNLVGYCLGSTRRLTKEGFTEKIDFLLDGRMREQRGLAKAPQSDLLVIRAFWADLVNEALSAAGTTARVDHRSLKERGIDLIPQTHLGPAAARRTRRGEDIDRKAGSTERDAHNARRITARPEIVRQVLDMAGEPFSPESVRRVLARYVDEPALRDALQALVVASPATMVAGPVGSS